MGLLDAITGMAGGNDVGGMLGELLEQQGGVGGLVERFQQGGLAEVAQSWVGTGENLPISAAQIEAVLGSDSIAPLAEKLGIEPGAAAGQIAALLPQLVDSLTPDGTLPDAGGLLQRGLDMLRGG
ncbi:YidB family protein [Chitinilyticum litopenaei]|uniref:YidB family protein n=1 Tax=Chitinilyticum litopenaei TaxID=1121276 RepID=UPI0003F58C23|nr:YidB family protein [Chitinilyticum litopenaei]